MKRIMSLSRLFGLDPSVTMRAVRALPRFLRDYRSLRRQLLDRGQDFPIARYYPVLSEDSEESGVAGGHYFHQDLHVARRVFEANPRRHLDVGSRVDGFVSHVAVFREIEVADIRRLSTTASNIRFVHCDLMDPRSVALLGQADSVSCLHVLEHFGLGRYGDAVSAEGHLRGLENLCALVAPGGRLYLSVPIGPQRIEFNAHRVFAAKTIPALMPAGFRLEQFSFVDDAGDIHAHVEFSAPDVARNFGCTFGCGIYEFSRTGT